MTSLIPPCAAQYDPGRTGLGLVFADSWYIIPTMAAGPIIHTEEIKEDEIVDWDESEEDTHSDQDTRQRSS